MEFRLYYVRQVLYHHLSSPMIRNSEGLGRGAEVVLVG